MVINYDEGIIGRFIEIKIYMRQQVEMAYTDNIEWADTLKEWTNDLINDLENKNISNNELIFVEEVPMGGFCANKVEIGETII